MDRMKPYIVVAVIVGLGILLSTVIMATVKHFDLGYTGTGVVMEKTSGKDCYVELKEADSTVDRQFVYGTACYSIEVGDTISLKNDMLVR